MTAFDIFIVIVIILCALVAGLYFLNKWAYKKLNAQQDLVERSKQVTTAFIIDKKKDKITNVNMPKVVIDNIPKLYKHINMYFVKAKIGPQIITLMCDKNVFSAITVKKNQKIELAGMYIVSVIGAKTAAQIKAEKKKKKQAEKAERKKKKKTE